MNDQTHSFEPSNVLDLTASIVVAFVSNPHSHVTPEIVNDMLKQTYSAITGLVSSDVEIEATPAEPKEPAVSIKASIKPAYLVCLEDGKKVTMLKRYIMTNFGLTPEQYRDKWNLPADYPMVAPDYSERRRELAKAIGLGSKGRVSKETVDAVANATGDDADAIMEAVKDETPDEQAPTKRRGRPAGSKNKEAKEAEAA